MLIKGLLEQAVREGLTPGAACFVSHGSQEFELHVGNSKPELEYDLASLTKILCTAYLTHQAVVEGRLAVDETPWSQWPGVSVRHVLDHNAGLPAWVRVHSFDDLKQIKLVSRPGEKRVYSDIGFMALGQLLEQRMGQKLDALFPPTQNQDRLAGRSLGVGWPHFHGPVAVDDENCRDLGGVAGHAGLFGTLGAVKSQAQYFLEHLDKQALGFDKPTPGGSTGEVLSAKAVGHLGFTGTSLWLDPETRSIYILLTRVLGRDNATRDRLKKLRREFHQQAAALGTSPLHRVERG